MGSDSLLILGIETSCDETAAAVVQDGRIILSNVIASQALIHAPYGGVFPEMASRQHIRDIAPVVDRALADAGVGVAGVDALAVTRGPGLSGALLVGLNFAKGLALASGLPLHGVNHLTGHLYSNWLHDTGAPPSGHAPTPSAASDAPFESICAPGGAEPAFPHITLIVSGGHTDLVLVRGHGDLVLLGGTLDDAAGEAFDKAARLLGLGYPGGPAIERSALAGRASAVELPVAHTERPLDLSFSGLKTALARIVSAEPSAGAASVADLAASFQSAVVRALVRATVRAAAAHQVVEVHLAGGVSANQPLRDALSAALSVPLRAPAFALCTDNAAMIAAAAYWQPSSDRDRDFGLAVDADASLALV